MHGRWPRRPWICVPPAFRLQDLAARRNIAQNRCFAIFYGERGNLQLSLAASTPDAKTLWMQGLTTLWKDKQADVTKMFLRKAWRESDKNNDSLLSFREVLQLLHRLNFDTSNMAAVQKTYNEFDANRRGLNYEQFTAFYRRIKYRPEVANVFKRFAKENPSKLTLAEFQAFLVQEQKQHLSAPDVWPPQGGGGEGLGREVAYAQQYDQRYSHRTRDLTIARQCRDPMPPASLAWRRRARARWLGWLQIQRLLERLHKGDLPDRNALSLEGFAAYFASEAADAFNPLHIKIYQVCFWGRGTTARELVTLSRSRYD